MLREQIKNTIIALLPAEKEAKNTREFMNRCEYNEALADTKANIDKITDAVLEEVRKKIIQMQSVAIIEPDNKIRTENLISKNVVLDLLK